MSTIERDELDSLIKFDVAGVWCVSYDDARRIVDGIKAKLAEVTRERDKIAEQRDTQNEKIAKIIEILYGKNGICVNIVEGVRYIVEREKQQYVDLAQAREQLEQAKAEAAAWRADCRKWFADKISEYEQSDADVFVQHGFTGRVSIVLTNLRNDFDRQLNTTAGRDLQDEMRRKDERIKELEQAASTHKDAMESARDHICRLARRASRKGRTAKAALVEHYRGKIDPAWFGDQPTPEPVYWRYPDRSWPRFRVTGSYVEVLKQNGGMVGTTPAEWFAKQEGESKDSLIRCNADGTPIKKPEVAELERQLADAARSLKLCNESRSELRKQIDGDANLHGAAVELREFLRPTSVSIGASLDHLSIHAPNCLAIKRLLIKMRDAEGGAK